MNIKAWIVSSATTLTIIACGDDVSLGKNHEALTQDGEVSCDESKCEGQDVGCANGATPTNVRCVQSQLGGSAQGTCERKAECSSTPPTCSGADFCAAVCAGQPEPPIAEGCPTPTCACDGGS